MLPKSYRAGMGSETIPTRPRDPGGEAATSPPAPAEPVERHAATLQLEHRGRRKRVQLRLDPVPETAPRHHRRPNRRVMRLRTEAGASTNHLVASDIPWTTVHFHAVRLLDREADREEWA